MTDYRVSAAGNAQVSVRGKLTRAGAGLVIYCHGHGGTGWGSISAPTSAPGQYHNISAMAEAGYLVIATDTGTPASASWSNDSAHTAINDAITLGQTVFGAKAGKVILMGTSMGGGCALSFTGRNPTKVAACIAIEPIVNLNTMLATFTDINTAYSGGYTDATYGANHNPRYQADHGAFAGIPLQVWYGDSDTTATPTDVLAFRDAVLAQPSPSIAVTALSGGHAESTTQQIPTATLTGFAQQYLSAA